MGLMHRAFYIFWMLFSQFARVALQDPALSAVLLSTFRLHVEEEERNLIFVNVIFKKCLKSDLWQLFVSFLEQIRWSAQLTVQRLFKWKKRKSSVKNLACLSKLPLWMSRTESCEGESPCLSPRLFLTSWWSSWQRHECPVVLGLGSVSMKLEKKTTTTMKWKVIPSSVLHQFFLQHSQTPVPALFTFAVVLPALLPRPRLFSLLRTSCIKAQKPSARWPPCAPQLLTPL